MSNKQVTVYDEHFNCLVGAAGDAVGTLERLASGEGPTPSADELKQVARALESAVLETAKNASNYKP